ncbi:MAG: hypothetical protein HY958_14765 [Bacteroidia bacterium]|nr:hypothetical protein [Bacteroidia bacterium]
MIQKTGPILVFNKPDILKKISDIYISITTKNTMQENHNCKRQEDNPDKKNNQTGFKPEYDEKQEKTFKECDVLISAFADYFKVFDMEGVASLLDDNGEFVIKGEWDVEDTETSKGEFLKWLEQRIADFKQKNPHRKELTLEYDHCLYCDYGAPVLLFENGKFPVFNRTCFELERTGIRLIIGNNKITGLSLCKFFILTKNREIAKIIAKKTDELYPDDSRYYDLTDDEMFDNACKATGYYPYYKPNTE